MSQFNLATKGIIKRCLEKEESQIDAVCHTLRLISLSDFCIYLPWLFIWWFCSSVPFLVHIFRILMRWINEHLQFNTETEFIIWLVYKNWYHLASASVSMRYFCGALMIFVLSSLVTLRVQPQFWPVTIGWCTWMFHGVYLNVCSHIPMVPR